MMSFFHKLMFVFLGLAFGLVAKAEGTLGFTQNMGQWHENVHYRAELQSGFVYLDQEGITFQLLENEFYTKLHDWIQGTDTVSIGYGHSLRVKFNGANLNQGVSPDVDLNTVSNYYLGNDPSRWASNVKTYNRVTFHEAYPGIDLRYGSTTQNLKYDFIVSPQGDPSQIEISFEGALGLSIVEGALQIETSIGAFSELAPFAYQLNSLGHIEQVECQYSLVNNQVKYTFPNGYDESKELVIDPEIAFSTFIGSGSSNFGFTASYDSDGNLYAGAIAFGPNYPTTTGSFQSSFAQGNIDCAITKFNSSGTDLLYSTYLGGTSNESPHSIVVNDNNELYILGTTSSDNFPITTGAYQDTYMGGTSITSAGYAYSTGSDIFVAKLSANGDQLLGSTYMGGSSNDGIGTVTAIDFNYGDRFRGEIVVDDEGNAYVASNTSSPDFPFVNGYATNGIGSLSGVIFKLSPNFDNLIWSTFSGGSNTETVSSLQLASDNSVYFAGGTTSSNLPVSAGAYQGSNSGGVDGFIGHISADGGTLINCTYNGTNQFDQNFFVQIDLAGEIYVVGQSLGDYPVSAGVYSNPNSGQYVHKLSADLSTNEWSTVIGSGNGGIDISPSAFLVSDCNQIYISGWGGELNNNGGGTADLPITSDAFQSETDDADFYVMVLDDDASGLVYATFFGGDESAEHVDGGTSRFDKNGTVYQAVCAGCGGNDDFPSQPGVWSDENPSNNCNLGVFKFKLSSVAAEALIDAPDVVCPGTEFSLINLSEGADTYLWDLGDETTSTEAELTHSYDEPGSYDITLYASHAIGCLEPDSTVLNITIEPMPNLSLEEPPLICPGEALALTASGADSYVWEPAAGLSDANVFNPVFTNDVTTSYFVTGTNICGSDTASIEVQVGNLDVTISEDQEVCPGESVQLSASGGLSYSWTPPTGLSDPDIANPTSAPDNDITYAVSITTADDCGANLTTEINVLPPPPELEGNTDYVSCNGDPVLLSVSGGVDYEWEPSNGLSSATTSSPWSSPVGDITYTVTSENSCGSDAMDITVRVNAVNVYITVDSTVCYNTPFTIRASGANNYIWQPKELVTDRLAQETLVKILEPSIISVTGFDTLGCFSTEAVLVNLFPREILRAGNDRIITYGDEVQIESFSIFPIAWDDSPHLSCINCNHPVANPLETTLFYATIVTPYGCDEVDSVKISVHGDLYVPNAFTPNGDGLNDFFKASGIDIVEFKMEIFDRWGQRVFVTEDFTKGWNGSLNGGNYFCAPDVYQYRIVATERYGELFEMQGIVTLIR